MGAVAVLILGLLVGLGGEYLYHRLRDPGARPAPSRARTARRLVALAVVLVIVAVPLGMLAYANYQFRQIPRVDVGSHLGGDGQGTNYLLVGSDARPGVGGNRSDTIMLVHAESGETKLLSIPRDLYVTIPSTGEKAKINAAYGIGPGNLIDAVRENLDLPVDRYLEINFVAFPKLVDALGGITINFPHPAFDTHSGLHVPQSGPVHLNGEQALAYVRSRYYTEIINGQEVTDPTADLGRVKRQQEFMRAVFSKLTSTKNPFRLLDTAGALTDGLQIDDKMSFIDALYFAWRLRSVDPNTIPLPTTPDTIDGSAVLLLDDGAAGPVLDQFR